ncbi:hypothetical protein LINPERHAP2_LOCUS26818 [Linum perenne]
MPRFKISRVWKDIRVPQTTVPWSSVVWSPPIIPRNSFLLWLVYLNRLPTAMKLASWGLVCDTSCRLCSNGDDSRDHLFFLCDYSFFVITEIFAGFIQVPRLDWEGMSNWILSLTSRRRGPVLSYRLLWSSVVSHIWRERCRRFYSAMSPTPPRVLVQRIKLELIALSSSRPSLASLHCSLMI